MSSLEPANIRPLNPSNPRSSDTVHPGSSNLSDFVEEPLPDDDQTLDTPLAELTDETLQDPLREADTEFPFAAPPPPEVSTPLPHQAVQRLLEPRGQMSPPLGSPPISTDDEVLPPLSDEIEQTRFVSQQELAELDGINTYDAGDYSPPVETGISTPKEVIDEDYFSPRSDDVRDELIDSMGDTHTPPSVKELIDRLAISEEKEGEAREMDTSYPTPEEFPSDDDPETSTALVLPLTPPLTPPLSPDPSPNVSDVGGIKVKVPNSSAHSDSGGTSYFVHVSDAGGTSLTPLTPTSERDGRVLYSAAMDSM